MRKVIEVFIRSKEVLTQHAHTGRPIAGHACTMKEGYRSQKIMSETERAALKIAEAVAEEAGTGLRIYDVGSFVGKMKASVKGIKSTPMIIVGKRKIEGIPKREDLLLLV